MEKSRESLEYQILLELLHEHRINASVTQRQLAKALEQSQSYVSKIERGELRLDVIQLRRVCEAIGVSFPSFMRELDKKISEHS